MVHLLSAFLTVIICSDIFIWNLGIAAESKWNSFYITMLNVRQNMP